MFSVGIEHFIVLSAILFVIGFAGLALSRHHAVRSLIAIEVMFLGVHILFVSFSGYHGHVHGQIISLFILAVAAAEAAIGLALLLAFFRACQKMGLKDMADLKE
jgi:NADH-quinone oxidoreductase subunit K